ncbi:MAG: ImmA/IrrE family metallo-endopeptidase [Gemmatimonadaceae bacterium]|nr:ImmA/IrrE family metallo-endopeptidase [Gemmatimonadaceae bacterium]
MSAITPSRLTLARQLRGLTKADLAGRIGVTPAAVTQWEGAHRTPDGGTIHRLAEALAVPVGFLAGAMPTLLEADTVSFRSLRTLARRDRDRACAAAEVASMLGKWIAEKFVLPDVALPDLSDMSPDMAAAEMRRVLQLGSGPLPSIVHLLEASGVRCFALGVDMLKADALSAWVDGIPLVLLNTAKSAERGRNDAAHELGHLTMHRHKQPSGDVAEKEAVAFAAEFLVPSESLWRQDARVNSLADLIALKRLWRVSAAFMLKRMTHLKLISDWSARALWQQLSANGYRGGEPDGAPREHSEVLTQLVQHLRQRHADRTFAFIGGETILGAADVRARIEGMLPLTAQTGGDAWAARLPAMAAPPALKLVR